MRTRSGRKVDKEASSTDNGDSTVNNMTTVDDTISLMPGGHASVSHNDQFSDNSSPSKRIKLDNGSAATKVAVAKMIQDPKSPLVKSNIRAMLSDHAAFDSLRQDQKEHLMAMLPAKDAIIDENGNRRPSDEFLRSDPDWAQSIGAYQEDLKEGRWDPGWIADAMEAHEQRQAGAFDEYKEGEYEEFWGQRQKLPNNVIAGMSSDVKLCDLFRRDILKIGDIWSFARTFGKKESNSRVLIEKEMKVTDVKAGQPTLVFPTGRAKLSRPGHEDIVLPNLTGPGHVVTAILETDGRIINAPNGNAWKSIRVLRDNQDLGTLWDIRQAYHFQDREGEYKSAVTGMAYRSHRAAMGQARQGLVWANPFTAVFQQVRLTNMLQQPPRALEIPPKFQDALNDIALPGATIIRVDYRIMIKDGMPTPMQPETEDVVQDVIEKAWLERMLQVGPNIFPTPFTREVASEHGPGWSQGHAHLGADALGAAWSATAGKKGLKKVNQQLKEDDDLGMIPIPISDHQRDQIIRLLDTNPSWIPQQGFFQIQGSPEKDQTPSTLGASCYQVGNISSNLLQNMTSGQSRNQPESFDAAFNSNSTNLLSDSGDQYLLTEEQTSDTANSSVDHQVGLDYHNPAGYNQFGFPYYNAYSPELGHYKTFYPPLD